jgi:spermidine synthase
VIRIRSWSDVPLTFAPDKGFGLPAAAHIGFFRVMAWTVLPMIGSVVLLATTNLLCQEIASVPLLWVLPLTLYLLSFIVCFNYPRFYQRWLFVPILTLSSVIAVVIVLLSVFAGATLQIGALLTVCLAANMTCHGELARLMPPSRELTKFYLMLALGGALGGVLVAVVAPRLFDGFYEFQLGLLASLLVLPTAGYFDGRFGSAYPQRSGLRLVQLWAGAGLLVFAIAIVASSLYYLLDPRLKPHQIHRERNEYGVLAVEELHGYRKFVHGRTEHGGEYISSDKLNFGSYYHPGSGVAVAIEAARNTAYVSSSDRRSRRLNVGVVGLGVGGILTWGNAGDAFVFFELDPAVERIAKQYFGYFQRTKAFTKVVLGDGRIQLDRRAAWLGETRSGPDHPDSFDVLVLDAFASDSIPIHLMTAECYQTYLQNLRQGGILVAHITNRFVDLRPVVYHHAIENGLTPILLETKKTETSPETRWVLMTRSQELAQIFQGHPNQVDWPKDLRPIRWTDDRASLWDVIRWSNSIEWSAIVENQNRLRNRRTIRPKK